MAQRKRQKIEFYKPEEPTFLKKLKNQMGIRNNDFVTIDTKKEKLDKKDLDYRDEEPTYVLDESSNITEKELENFRKKTEQEKEYQKDNELIEQRIIFKLPEKRSNDHTSSSSLSKAKKLSDKNSKIKSNKDRLKTVKNSNLLSFGDDDDDFEYED